MSTPSNPITSTFETREYHPTQLTKASFLPDLFNLVNRAYNGEFPRSAARLATPSQIVDELGADPNTFTFITFDNDKPIATASGKLYFKDYLVDFEDARASVPLGGSWILSMVATDPQGAYQGKGLAQALVKKVEDAMVARAVQIAKERKGELQDLRIIIKLTKHANLRYWTKRGFHFITERDMPIGWWNSLIPFTVVVMQKPLVVRK
jgi:Acetyltransferase (GNAT) family